MTSPTPPCPDGYLDLGDNCPGEVGLCLRPGRAFTAALQLRDPVTKLPMDWPGGTTTRLWFSWGTGTEMIVAGTVDGSYLRYTMTPAQTEQLPRGTLARVELNYTGDPDDWITWREGRVRAC